MTKILAVDQATVSGYCLAGDKMDFPEWVCGHFRAPKRPAEGDRLIIIHDSILGLLDSFAPDLLAMEAPFDPTVGDMKAGKERPQFNRSTMQFLQRVKGAVIMAAARRSVPVEEYQPRSWRATLKLPSRPPELKSDAKWVKNLTLAAVRMYGIKAETLDEGDAAGIAFHACFGKPGIERATGDLLASLGATL